jgi:hypothetical protein
MVISYEVHQLKCNIKTEQLQWYGHVQRMEVGRLPKEIMKWRPLGRRRRGRPKLTWAEGIKGLMGEKGLMEEDWNDRSNWREKIIFFFFFFSRLYNPSGFRPAQLSLSILRRKVLQSAVASGTSNPQLGEEPGI